MQSKFVLDVYYCIQFVYLKHPLVGMFATLGQKLLYCLMDEWSAWVMGTFPSPIANINIT